MLLHWKRREGEEATYLVLHDALCHDLVDRKDLANNICRQWLLVTDANMYLKKGQNDQQLSKYNQLALIMSYSFKGNGI